MFSDGPKYAYKHLKLCKSYSFGNWSSSNVREYFLITTLHIYCNLSRWEGQKQREGLVIKHHKLAQKNKMMDNRALQRETRCFTDNSQVINNHYSDGDKKLTNLHIKQWKTVVKLCWKSYARTNILEYSFWHRYRHWWVEFLTGSNFFWIY